MAMTNCCFTFFPPCFAGLHRGEDLITLEASLSRGGYSFDWFIHGIVENLCYAYIRYDSCNLYIG